MLFIIKVSWAQPQEEKWNDILYYQSGKNLVLNNEFFLHENGQYNSKIELKHTIALLKSEVGNKVACAFPFRYQWIMLNYKNIPTFDLNKCEELSGFIAQFGKDKLSIGYVSGSFYDPSSSFGHIFLAFNNKNRSVDLADTIQFSAEADTKNLWNYIQKGVFGGFQGFYHREPFFKKLHNYTVVEQRYIYLYDLDFTPKEIKQLIYFLYEQRKSKFNYFFTSLNCVSQIEYLLNLIRPNLNDSSVLFPADIIKNRINATHKKQVFIPSLVKFNKLLENFSESEYRLFNTFIQDYNNVDTSKLNNTIKEALDLYYEYEFRSKRKILPNYSEVKKLNYYPVKFDLDYSNFEINKNYQKIDFGVSFSQLDDSLSISYSPLIINNSKYLNPKIYDYKMSVLDIDLNIKNRSVDLNSFSVFDVFSKAQSLMYQPYLYWNYYLGANRENKLRELKSVFSVDIGLGTERKNSIYRIGLTLGLDLEKLGMYYEPSLAFGYDFSGSYQAGVNISRKYFSVEHFSKEYFLVKKLTNSSLSLTYEDNDSLDNKTLKILYSFDY